jgi:hypothetical protein
MTAQVCIACDCVDDEYQFTPAGKGPFCGECFEALCDPDQALLTERRLEQSENALIGARADLEGADKIIEHLSLLCVHAADALEEYASPVPQDYTFDETETGWNLIKELRKAAQ